jgi:hypothetical protein
MSRRRNRSQEAAVDPQNSGIPPFIDQFGREVWENPWGQYRPNPRLTTTTKPTPRSATGLPVIPKPTAEHEPAPAPTDESAPEATPTPAAPAVGPPVELAPATHQVTDDGRIEADDERIRSTIQYAKGYAKACEALGIEIPDEMRARLKSHTAKRRGRVHKRVRRTVAVATAVGGGFVGINAAAAYMTSHGSGTGSGTGHTGTLQAVTIAATGTITSQLFPGGTADLHLHITNPNSDPVKVTAVTQNGPVTNDKTGAGCTNDAGTWPSITLGNSGVSVSASQPPAPITITAVNGASQSVDLAAGASMTAASNNGCQGATFTIPVSVTVQQP